VRSPVLLSEQELIARASKTQVIHRFIAFRFIQVILSKPNA